MVRLVRVRPCPVPTAAGWLLLLLGASVAVVGWVRAVHPFLALDAPVPATLLVVEGWLPDQAIERAVARFRDGDYDALVVTGGPLDRGARLSRYATHAHAGAAVAVAAGAPPGAVHAVPAPPVVRDRTLASALALGQWLHASERAPASLNVVTLGPHARRSRLLFRRALGPQTQVGVIAEADPGYDAQRWWRSSSGVRAVSGEWIAYLYARFQPHRPPVEEAAGSGV